MAGGKSRRMGVDKTLLPLGGYQTLVHYQVAKLSQLFERVYVSAKGEKFGPLPVPLILDEEDEHAPMVGLATIFGALADNRIFVIAADTPFVTFKTIRMIATITDGEAVVPETPHKRHALCALYDRRIEGALRDHIAEGRHKMMAFLAQIDTRIVACEDESEFDNLNTPEDYARAQERIEHNEINPS